MPRRVPGWFRLPVHLRELAGRDTEDEIRLHLELRAEQLVRAGLTPERARAEARRRFGDIEHARRHLGRSARAMEDRMRLRDALEGLWQDVTYGVRSLGRERYFSFVVVLTMALAIGANAAMFGVLDRMLLRGPEHVQDRDRVTRVVFTTTHPQFGERTGATFGYVAYAALRDHVRSFQSVAAYSVSDALLGGSEGTERIRLGAATWDFFPLLGVRPRLGRFYDESEDRPPEGERVAVLSHGLWTRLFSADETAIGRSVELNGRSHTIVGVAPAGFTGIDLQQVDAWIPMSTRSAGITDDWPSSWNASWLNIVARLAPGAAPERAGAEATAAFRGAWGEREGFYGEAELSLVPSHFDRSSGREPLEAPVSRWLVGVALVVLLIACANVANLQLARATRHERQVAVRLALGIGRTRLVRLLLVQSLLLCLAGGAAGLALAHWGGAVLRGLLLPGVQWTSSPVDVRVLVVTLALAVATGLLTGLLPALQAVRRDVTASLRTGVREGGGRRVRARSVLTIAQAALCVLLLTAAGLFLRSLSNVMNLDLGLEADRALVVSLSWPQLPRSAATEVGDGSVGRAADADHDPAAVERQRRARFYETAVDELRAMPEVAYAALAVGTPFRSSFSVRLRVPGYDSIPELPGGGPYVSAVTGGYFEAVGTQLVRGRTFTSADRAGSEPVAILNETMARTLWPAGDALGECLHIGDESDGPRPCSRIVGVVRDARRFRLREDAAMQYYIPFGQEAGIGGTTLLVRPRGDMASSIPALRARVRQLDGGVGYVNIGSLQESLDPQVRPWRLGAMLFGVFGLLALGIAAVGLYSVIAYGVAQRGHEMGVRMALGARSANVLGMVLFEGARLAAIGIGIGLLLALMAGNRVEPLLFDTSPRDGLVLALVAGTLFAVGLLASLLPAARATRVDPVVALRSD